MTKKTEIRIALFGHKFMGVAHSNAFRNAGMWIVWLVIMSINIQCDQAKGPSVIVYSSSRDGDRLTLKTGEQFTGKNASGTPDISVIDSVRYQKIDGFGATFNEAGMICLNSLSEAARDSVLKKLFDPISGAGFNVMKAPMASCDFASAGPWYSYDEIPGDTLMTHFSIDRDLGPNGQVTFINKAMEYQKFQIESTMDFAPDWMMFGLKPGEKHIKPEYYRALARYYAKYIKAYEAHGITIDYLNPFNEAENSWYSNVTYKEIGEMIKHYIIPEFKAEGITTQIQLCETSGRPEALQKFPVVLDDPEAAKYISTLTVHGYDWNKYNALTDLHNRYPVYPIWMTEVCYARVNDQPSNEPPGGPGKLPDYDFSDGEFWGNMIMNDMKNWVSAWVYWNMILDQDGGPWLISEVHGDPDNNRQQPVVIINRNTGKVTYTGLYYYLAHFSKFIKPGAYRIDCTGGSPQLNFAAFLNPDRHIVLNIINNGNEIECNIKWRNRILKQKLKTHSITTMKWGI